MKKFWIALALSALAGGVAVLLFTPQSGSSTRRKLKRSLEDLGDNLSDAADYLKAQAERLGKEAQELVQSGSESLPESIDAVGRYVKGVADGMSGEVSRLM